MARIRSTHPSTFTSASFSALSAELERTLSRLRGYLDDQGRGLDSPLLIKAAIYPLHVDQTAEVIDAELDELQRLQMVIRWEQDGKKYICERPEAWDEQQRPQKPTASKCPVPPGYLQVDYRPKKDEETHSSGAIPESYVIDAEPLPELSRSGPGQLSPGKGGGKGDRRLEEEGEAQASPCASPPPDLVNELLGTFCAVRHGRKITDRPAAVEITASLIAQGHPKPILFAVMRETFGFKPDTIEVALDKAYKAEGKPKPSAADMLRAEIRSLERQHDPELEDLIASKRERLDELEGAS